MGDNMILDATLSTSNASAAAIWRIRDSSVELGRSFPYAARIGFDVSLAIDRMEEYADTIDARIRAVDPHAFAVVFGHAGDGNLHIGLHHEHKPEKRDTFEKLVYDITGRIRRLDLGRTRHRHPEAAIPQDEPDRRGNRNHAHAQARARSEEHPEPGTNFYGVNAPCAVRPKA